MNASRPMSGYEAQELAADMRVSHRPLTMTEQLGLLRAIVDHDARFNGLAALVRAYLAVESDNTFAGVDARIRLRGELIAATEPPA